MSNLLRFVSLVALAATVIPPVLYLAGTMNLAGMKAAMLFATIIWFVATPWWMK